MKKNLWKSRLKTIFIVLVIMFAGGFFTCINATDNSTVAQQPGNVVTGTVTTAEGEKLPGVNIIIKGTSIGTVTDVEGNYSLVVPEEHLSGELQISYVGYLTETLKIAGQRAINVIMIPDLQLLEEIVVIGYGVQRKSDLTGAIASVSGEKLVEVPVAGVDQALQGRAAGVNVISNTGMPGGSISIQIRGISSINGNQPLVIVDGVPSSLNGLNPNDVESIEVLKDASSAAIYGASGGNGVILITTKKGSAGKAKASFNFYRGWQEPWKKVDVCNSQEYARIMNWIAILEDPNDPDYFSTQPDTLPNYDWQDIMFRTAVMDNYDFSISGGNEISTYMLSTSYTTQEGILRNSDYNRLTVRINSDHKLGKRIKIGENVNFINSKTNGYDEWVYTQEYNTPMRNILPMYPYLAPYDEEGVWTKPPNGSNPKVAEDVLHEQRYRYNLAGNTYAEINLLKGLTFISRLSGGLNFEIDDIFKPVYDHVPTDKNEVSSVEKTVRRHLEWNWQNYATYALNFLSDHNITVMAGMESGYDKNIDITGTREGLINETPEMRYFNASLNDTSLNQLIEGGGDESSRYAYFGRLNYDYKGKYLLTANFRRDGSSRFGPGYRFGNFPSFSAGWKFSEEEFARNIPYLSFGKLRFGWGSTGANAPGLYAYYARVNSTLSAFNYIYDRSSLSTGAAPVQMPNREIRWETMIMSNVGIDLGFFENQLNFTADYFVKTSEDMLLYQPQPALSGIYQFASDVYQLGGDARPIVNVGSIENKGLELSLGYRKISGSLRHAADFNITFIKNKVLDLKGDSLAYGSVGVNLSPITMTKAGYPMSQFYGFVTDGIFTEEDAAVDEDGRVYIWNQPFTINAVGDTIYAQRRAAPGDLHFVDVNGDSLITNADRTMIGSPLPKFTLGFSYNIEYKGFDMNLFLQGSFGNKIFNGIKNWLYNQEVGGNRSTDLLDQYRSPVYDDDGNLVDAGNTNTTMFRLDPRGLNGNLTRVSDIYIEDGSYLRLKNIQLGYTLPAKLTQRVGIESFRIYVGAKNLITITKYTGFDPEIGPNVSAPAAQRNLLMGTDKGATYPQTRMYLTGINMTF